MKYNNTPTLKTVSKFKSRSEWEIYVWNKLNDELVKLQSGEQLGTLLASLMTKHERQNILNRVAAISFIKQGKSYREISELLWLSPQTISAIRKSLQVQRGYISRYTRNKKLEKKQKPLTTEELDLLLFTSRMKSLFTLPMPPLRHPRLMRQLGYKSF